MQEIWGESWRVEQLNSIWFVVTRKLPVECEDSCTFFPLLDFRLFSVPLVLLPFYFFIWIISFCCQSKKERKYKQEEENPSMATSLPTPIIQGFIWLQFSQSNLHNNFQKLFLETKSVILSYHIHFKGDIVFEIFFLPKVMLAGLVC